MDFSTRNRCNYPLLINRCDDHTTKLNCQIVGTIFTIQKIDVSLEESNTLIYIPGDTAKVYIHTRMKDRKKRKLFERCVTMVGMLTVEYNTFEQQWRESVRFIDVCKPATDN